MRSVTQTLANYLCIFYHAFNPSFSLPMLEVLNESESIPTEPRTKAEAISQQVVNFFNPVTCKPRQNQAVLACQAGEHINQTLCLEHKCCISSKRLVHLDCYTPFEDRFQQILRMFCAGFGGIMVVALLPFCCFVVERSPCANPLRRPRKDDPESEDSSDNQSAD